MLLLVLMTSFSQCSTAQKLQKKAPIEFGVAYAQEWVAGVQGGGSGINVFIPAENNSLELDSMFFRGQKVKIQLIKEDNTYVGRFKTSKNQSNDIILSSDMMEESKNKLPKFKTDIPFELNDYECLISYQIDNETLYYKISNIKMEQPLHFPSTPPKGQ
jgi:hypothetical protein